MPDSMLATGLQPVLAEPGSLVLSLLQHASQSLASAAKIGKVPEGERGSLLKQAGPRFVVAFPSTG
jgi:hypothetical protein